MRHAVFFFIACFLTSYTADYHTSLCGYVCLSEIASILQKKVKCIIGMRTSIDHQFYYLKQIMDKLFFFSDLQSIACMFSMYNTQQLATFLS